MSTPREKGIFPEKHSLYLGTTGLYGEIPQVDFALFAHALGAEGAKVTSRAELETALRTAITQAVPTVIDVRIDRRVLPPVLERNSTVKSL